MYFVDILDTKNDLLNFIVKRNSTISSYDVILRLSTLLSVSRHGYVQ